MSWQPEGDSFAQLAGLLSDSLNGQDHVKSSQALHVSYPTSSLPLYPAIYSPGHWTFLTNM